MFRNVASTQAAQYGTPEEAKAMLERAVSAGKEVGQEIMGTASEGKVSEVTYWWPRPGSEESLEKVTYFTKVEDQICAVGYYK